MNRRFGLCWGMVLFVSASGCQAFQSNTTGLGLLADRAGLSDSGNTALRRVLTGAVERLLDEQRFVYLFSDHQDNLTLSLTNDFMLAGRRVFSGEGVVLQEQGHVDTHGFSGQMFDFSTGLWSYKWRSLAPSAGRWLSSDPLFHKVDANSGMKLGEAATAYAFVANQLGNRVDPTGQLIGKIGKVVKKAGKKIGKILETKGQKAEKAKAQATIVATRERMHKMADQYRTRMMQSENESEPQQALSRSERANLEISRQKRDERRGVRAGAVTVKANKAKTSRRYAVKDGRATVVIGAPQAQRPQQVNEFIPDQHGHREFY